MKKINKTKIKLRFNGDSPYWNTAQSRRDLAMCKAINVLAATVDELVDEVNTLKEELCRVNAKAIMNGYIDTDSVRIERK